MANHSIEEVLVYLMVVMSASDKSMSDPELSRIGSLIRTLPVFDAFDEDELIPAARRCQQLLAGENGLDVIFDLANSVIPERLRDTAYAAAVDVAAADLDVRSEEMRVLERLRAKLEIDQPTASAIERAARARHRLI